MEDVAAPRSSCSPPAASEGGDASAPARRPADDRLGTVEVDVEVEERPGGAVVTVALAGEVDVACADALRERLERELLAGRPTALRLDLDRLAFLDSSGLQALVRFEREACSRGCVVTVHRPQPIVRRALEVTGLDDVLRVEPGAPG